MSRRVAAFIAAVAVTASALVGVAALTPAQPASAADLSQFRAGNIISDEVFWAPNTMSAEDIQSFLASKVATCSSGATCLKDYRQDTWTRAADPMCAQYNGAAKESAATIIAKVSVACGLNPQVMLVLLQKEQGLVTRTNPGTYQYRSATGYGCPDTAPCDSEFFGFFNQVYKAAWAFKRYTMPAGTGAGTAYTSVYSRYAAGTTANVLWHPNSSCGSSPVYIENKATASLYFYTPYQPNGAALGAGYSTGDSCSSYGNRNFYNYFTDWFGSTRYVSVGAIRAAYVDAGGATSSLGLAAGTQVCGIKDGGCYQQFERGEIHWSPATGAHETKYGTAIRGAWADGGYENGRLGYPTSDEQCGLARSGCYQSFQGGEIHWSPATGAGVTYFGTAIRGAWDASGWERGVLGYPLSTEQCGIKDGGCYQTFERGQVHWSPSTGAQITRFGTAIRGAWDANGWENGALGYPVNAESCGLARSGCYQKFQRGEVHWSPSSGAAVTIYGSATRETWAANGFETGRLGYPTGSERCGLVGGGCYQPFQYGEVHWSAGSGAHVTMYGSGIRGAWAAQGYESGRLGYPTSDEYATAAGAAQDFQGGRIVWTRSNNRTAVQ